MNDEQRGMACFGAQPGGTGPFFPGTVLHFARVRQVHYAQCALFRKKMAAVADLKLVLTGPSEALALAPLLILVLFAAETWFHTLVEKNEKVHRVVREGHH